MKNDQAKLFVTIILVLLIGSVGYILKCNFNKTLENIENTRCEQGITKGSLQVGSIHEFEGNEYELRSVSLDSKFKYDAEKDIYTDYFTNDLSLRFEKKGGIVRLKSNIDLKWQ